MVAGGEEKGSWGGIWEVGNVGSEDGLVVVFAVDGDGVVIDRLITLKGSRDILRL